MTRTRRMLLLLLLLLLLALPSRASSGVLSVIYRGKYDRRG
tara:strand:- start:2204 stop:2326 length:123 start_codon:yes stop_codon:yes gene_type:complete